MHYYRTSEDTLVLARQYKDRFSNRSDLLDFIQEHHDLVELGYFSGTTRYGFWVTQQGIQGQSESSEFRAAPEVMDFLVNEGVFTDMFSNNHTVILFVRMKGGHVADVVALNFAALIDPSDL
ncbi:MAG: hypothetical protein AAFX99_35295 [Myxococcota bacterium]